MWNESRLMGRPLHAGVSAVDEIALAEDVSRLCVLLFHLFRFFFRLPALCGPLSLSSPLASSLYLLYTLYGAALLPLSRTYRFRAVTAVPLPLI